MLGATGLSVSMPKIDTARRASGIKLPVLERERIFDRSGRPDYEILRAIIQYFQDYGKAPSPQKRDDVRS
jgi:hypothetical protein